MKATCLALIRCGLDMLAVLYRLCARKSSVDALTISVRIQARKISWRHLIVLLSPAFWRQVSESPNSVWGDFILLVCLVPSPWSRNRHRRIATSLAGFPLPATCRQILTFVGIYLLLVHSRGTSQ